MRKLWITMSIWLKGIPEFTNKVTYSMIFKVDANTNCDFLYRPLIKITSLSNHSENLVKATVKNIMVASIKITTNKTLIPFIHSFAFHDFLISIIKELLSTTEEIEELILTPKHEKQLQNKILDLGDLLDYLRDILQSLHDHFPSIYNFLLFMFQLFYIVQLLIPLLRYDLKIKPQINIGLNCGLFVLNRLLELTDNIEQLERYCIAPLFFRNKMLSPWVQSFNFSIIKNSEDIINFYYTFPNNPENSISKPQKSKKFSLFSDNLTNKIKRVSSRDNLKVLNNPSVKIDIEKKLVPRVFNIVENNNSKDLARGSFIFRDSKIINCLVSFLKTKDDNMLLLSTNIMLQVMKNFKIYDSVKQEIADRCSENLVSDVKFRLITYENISKLLVRSITQDYRNPQRLIITNLKKKIGILKQITGKNNLNIKLASIFKKVCKDFDSGEMMFAEKNLIPREKSLNYLSLINYSFYEDISKLKYLSLFFKYHLTDLEVIEIEIRKFIILKNLRYNCRCLSNGVNY